MKKLKIKNFMLGSVAILLLLVIAFFYVSCSKQPYETNSNPDNTDSGIVSTDSSYETDTEKPSDTDTEKPGDTETPGSSDTNTETPGTETPGTETPGTENPGTENPGTENPGTETPGTENPGTETPGDETPDTPPVEDDITLEEFVADKGGATALNFANGIIEGMINYSDMKSIAYSYQASEGKITSIDVAYIVDGEGTERQLMKAEINIVGGVEMQDIIDGTATDLTTTSETTGTLLTFDAKEEANKGSASTIQTQIDTAIKTALGEDATVLKEYQTETFSATVADWAQANAEQINTILSNKCLDKIVSDCYFGMYTKDQIQNARWVLEGETEATGAKLVCEVNYGSGAQVQVIDINFSNPVQLDKIDNLSNVQISSVSVDYNFGYNHETQSRTDLINALFKAVGVNEVGGQRYLKDIGEDTFSYGKVHGYTVVEISNTEIKEYTIYVIHTSAYLEDAQAIEKLANSANFKVEDSKVIDISGASVEYVAQAAQALSARTGTAKRTIIATIDGKQFIESKNNRIVY